VACWAGRGWEERLLCGKRQITGADAGGERVLLAGGIRMFRRTGRGRCRRNHSAADQGSLWPCRFCKARLPGDPVRGGGFLGPRRGQKPR